MSLVRDNLMSRKGYTPYCGDNNCNIMPRTFFNGKQFKCSCCGWESKFESTFIDVYKTKWGISKQNICQSKNHLIVYN